MGAKGGERVTREREKENEGRVPPLREGEQGRKRERRRIPPFAAAAAAAAASDARCPRAHLLTKQRV